MSGNQCNTGMKKFSMYDLFFMKQLCSCNSMVSEVIRLVMGQILNSADLNLNLNKTF